MDYVEYGLWKSVNMSLIDVKIGNYVLVHGGFAIRVLSSKGAEETLEASRRIPELQEPIRRSLRPDFQEDGWSNPCCSA